MHRRDFMLSAAALSFAVQSAQGDESSPDDLPDPMTFGHLRGRFVYDGEPPEPKPIEIFRDRGAFGELKLVDESLLVDHKTKGLANLLIELIPPQGEAAPKLHAHRSYEKTAKDVVPLEYKGGRITQRVVPVRPTQTLKIANSDPVGHHFRVHFKASPSHSVVLAPGSSHEVKLKAAEPFPTPVFSNIHPWIRSYIVARDNPYHAVTGGDGRFEFRNIPLGEWTFRLWHEQSGYVTRFTTGGKQVELPQRTWKIKIRAAVTDLGEIKVPPEVFAR